MTRLGDGQRNKLQVIPTEMIKNAGDRATDGK